MGNVARALCLACRSRRRLASTRRSRRPALPPTPRRLRRWEDQTVDHGILDRIARAVASPSSRRCLVSGTLLTTVLAWRGPLSPNDASAGKRGKRCRPRCKDAAVCKKGRCRCLAPARLLRECAPDESSEWCVPAKEGNPRLCCPEHRIYVNCPLEDGKLPPGNLCTAPEDKAPAVCCPQARLCGRRCCEKPFTCLDAAKSDCSGEPPTYARLKRPR